MLRRTCWMQFWQPCWKILLLENWIDFSSFLFQNFPQKISFEQVQCNHGNPARTILFKILLFFSQIPEKVLFSRNFLEKVFMTRLMPF